MHVRLAIVLPCTSRECLDTALDILTSVNRLYLRTHPRTPRLYDAGIRWKKQPMGVEDWLTIPAAFEEPERCDCKVMAAWRAAELQELGEDARAYVYKVRPGLWHAVVRREDGSKEDPSRVLGMGQHNDNGESVHGARVGDDQMPRHQPSTRHAAPGRGGMPHFGIKFQERQTREYGTVYCAWGVITAPDGLRVIVFACVPRDDIQARIEAMADDMLPDDVRGTQVGFDFFRDVLGPVGNVAKSVLTSDIVRQVAPIASAAFPPLGLALGMGQQAARALQGGDRAPQQVLQAQGRGGDPIAQGASALAQLLSGFHF